MKRILLPLMIGLMLTGCAAQVTAQPSPVPSAEPTAKPTATPTPKPSPSPSPTPLFTNLNDRGDLAINEDALSSILPTQYPMDRPCTILLYHTHAREAFRQEGKYKYEETEEGSFKTTDYDKSIVKVGEALKKELESYGFIVIHDTTDVEPPEITSAYSRSLQVMEKYGSSIDIYFDLHRNAADVRFKSDDVVIIDEKCCARMFFVVGTGIGTYEGEYDVTPDWRSNYALALSLTNELRQIDEGLALDIRPKVGRFNQHKGPMCLLLELGHNANTMQDVLNSLPHFARAFANVVVLAKP